MSQFTVSVVKVERGTELSEALLSFVENCSWDEVRGHLAGVIRAWEYEDWETPFAAVEDGVVVGTASVLKTDYYPLPDVFPWVSSIFVAEQYRRRGICGELIAHANRYLEELGFDRSYIPTEFKGLYERYGYEYLRDIVNYGGGTDHLYMKKF